MARYDEAQADYRQFANTVGGIGTEISGEERKLKEDLDRREAAGDDSERSRRDELMRAIDVSATSILLISRDLTMPYRPEVSSFGKITVQHSPYPHKTCKNALAPILTQNP